MSDHLIFKLLDRPDLAKPTGTITLGRTVKGTLNPSGYVNYVLHPKTAEPLVVSAVDGIDGFDIYDSSGEIVDYHYAGNSEIYDLGTEEYRLVGWRDEYHGGRQGELLVTPLSVRDMPSTGLTGGSVTGTVTSTQPVIDYRFRTADSTTRLLSLAASGVTASIIDSSDDEVCTGESTCELAGGTDYRLRIALIGNAADSPFTVHFEESSALIDGGTEASGYLGYGERDTHTLTIGPGRTATLQVTSTDSLVDVDVRLSDGQVFNTEGDETFSVEGPFDGSLEVYLYSSGDTGSYTLTIQSS